MTRCINRRELLAGAALALWLRPLTVPAAEKTTLRTAAGRDSEITVWRARGRRRGLILFSHGANSAPHLYERLLSHWAAAGFEIRAPLHVDSEQHPDKAKFSGFASWGARIEDMRALAASVKDAHYVAAGHSYGALVALALGGAAAAQPEGVSGSLRDPRVKAAIAFSPPGPVPKLIDAAGYGALAVPALIQTGDRDVPPGMPVADGWKLHLAAYDAAAPGGDRYGLVLAGVDHYFGGLICREEVPGPQQPRQLEIAADISTQFLLAFGAGDARARRRLDRRVGAKSDVVFTRK